MENYLTRQELVTLAHISHGSFAKYVSSGDVVVAKDAPSNRIMYDPISVENIKRRKAEDNAVDKRVEGFVTRIDILEQARINELGFAKYLKSGDIIRVSDERTNFRSMYLAASIDNVLRRKAEKKAAKPNRVVEGGVTIEDLTKTLASLSKKMLDRITQLEQRIACLENSSDPHSQTY
jgi:hypothetical protein